jgi:hypothetical protein
MVAIGGLASGLIGGLLLAPFVSTHEARAEPAENVTVSCPQASLAAFSAEVRRITREELAASNASFRVDAEREPLVEPATAAAVQVADDTRARALVGDAIGRGRWTDEDADSLRERMAGLAADQRGEIVRLLSVAINQGGLVPESDRLPF